MPSCQSFVFILDQKLISYNTNMWVMITVNNMQYYKAGFLFVCLLFFVTEIQMCF